MKTILQILFLIFLTSKSFGQYAERQVYGSNGGCYEDQHFSYSWTLGEVIIDSYFNSNFQLTQGFLQPSSEHKLINDTISFYNAFSPNNDGVNDYWNISMLNFHPSNRVIIVNRLGVEVWSVFNYDNNQNKFVGENHKGENLPDGTYLYEISYGLTIKKGWLFIKR